MGDLPDLKAMVCRISLLSREGIPIFRDKYVFPYQRLAITIMCIVVDSEKCLSWSEKPLSLKIFKRAKVFEHK